MAFMEVLHLIFVWSLLQLKNPLLLINKERCSLQSLCFLKPCHKLLFLKRRLSSGKRWKIICEHYSFLLCKCGRTSDKTCSLRSMALQMPSYSKYACNIVNIGGQAFYATCSCSPIYIFRCTVFVTLPDLAKFLIILMIPEHCNTHKFLYARWSTFSGRFHTVSFTMQSHDQNSTSSLNTGKSWRKKSLFNE